MVVAVLPEYIEASIDPVLQKHFHFENVKYIKAFKPGITRMLGFGNLGYRSLLQYYFTVNRILKRESFDLIYFSTTAFPVMSLGRVWKRRFKTPFVIDLQDPWRNDFYLTKSRKERPPKYYFAHRLNSILERWTIKRVDGIISVSESYPEILEKRYCSELISTVIPFSASKSDFNLIKDINLTNKIFKREKGFRYIIYTGAVTPGMPVPLEILLKAFRHYISDSGDTAIKLIFIGTTYEQGNGSKFRAIPIGKKLGIEKYMMELPERIGYFDALKVLTDTDLIIFPGSLDSGYTASKIYPYILSEKPIFALSHEMSSVARILKGCNTGPVITFSGREDLENKQDKINSALFDLLDHLPEKSEIHWKFFEQYSEETMVRKQLDFFKLILSKSTIQFDYNSTGN